MTMMLLMLAYGARARALYASISSISVLDFCYAG